MIIETAWEEYAAVKEVEHMDNVEVLEYVDSKVCTCHELTMSEYRNKAIELKVKERKES